MEEAFVAAPANIPGYGSVDVVEIRHCARILRLWEGSPVVSPFSSKVTFRASCAGAVPPVTVKTVVTSNFIAQKLNFQFVHLQTTRCVIGRAADATAAAP